jgi:hypothetical protein
MQTNTIANVFLIIDTPFITTLNGSIPFVNVVFFNLHNSQIKKITLVLLIREKRIHLKSEKGVPNISSHSYLFLDLRDAEALGFWA